MSILFGTSRKEKSTILFYGRPALVTKNLTYFFPDQGNEELRAQINALKYELDSLQQERELSELRHEKELREIRSKAEADFRRAQVCFLPVLKQRRCFSSVG